MRVAGILVLAAAVAGCADVPTQADATLPGVRTESFVQDDFVCGPLLFPAGCAIVRIEAVDSGCAPEVPGYVRCDATVWWTATSGTVHPEARLVTRFNGTQGPSCTPVVGSPCTVRGNVTWSRAFGGPGEDAWWNVTFAARLEGPPEAAAGSFTLALAMRVRTEPAGAADV